MAAHPTISNQDLLRRSGNFQRPIWDYGFLQSLKTEFKGESYSKHNSELKDDVKRKLERAVNPLLRLELIDTLQRLGIAYNFEDEVKEILKNVHTNKDSDDAWMMEDLHATALQFKLLRQHGYPISSEIFRNFQDEMGDFKTCLCEDLNGLLSLYEASFLREEGESILEVAREFTINSLKNSNERNQDQYLSMIINHSLELPVYWRMSRLETRWFIDAYETKQDMDHLLLEFAKLDYNLLQATYQEDIKHASEWWKNTGIGEKLSFARDRLVESFLATLGEIFEPQYGYYRRMSTRVNAIITTIDDTYDVYGTLDEVELFTIVVDSWDVNSMEQLPDYMKISFLTLHNSTNEVAIDVLREQGFDVIPYLKKAWADLCKAYLKEAKWYYSGYTPSLQEYLENAWISVSGPLVLVYAYFLVKTPITNDSLSALKDYPDIIRWSSMILRLANDLQTSSHELKRGDVLKSMQCYMHETGASEEKAREYIHDLISECWNKMNKERAVANSLFHEKFIGIALNLARTAQCMYQYGDGFGIVDRETKDRFLSLVVHPIPVKLHSQ